MPLSSWLVILDAWVCTVLDAMLHDIHKWIPVSHIGGTSGSNIAEIHLHSRLVMEKAWIPEAVGQLALVLSGGIVTPWF